MRRVVVRQWLGWRQDTALTNPALFADFAAVSAGAGISSPVVVHGSRGCGRAGVFIAVANNYARLQSKVIFLP